LTARVTGASLVAALAALTVVIVDHEDSFTWNLAAAFEVLGAASRVVPAVGTTPDALAALRPDRLVLSAGPGRPERAEAARDVLARFAGRVPVLGVCLGHQVIALHYGGRVVRAPRPVHGRTSAVDHDGAGPYRTLPQGFAAARYHSLAVDPASLPDCLVPTATAEDGVLMGLRHEDLPVEGVQFHPESFLTERGSALLANWLETP